MQANFQLDSGDVNPFTKVVNDPQRQQQVFMLPIAVLLLVYQLFASPSSRLFINAYGWLAIASRLKSFGISIVCILLFQGLFILISRDQTKRQPIFKGPQNVELDEEGITSTSPTGRETTFWPAIIKVVDTPGHFFMLKERPRTHRGPQPAFMVPKRAFESSEQAREFITFAQEQWTRHHSNVAPIAAPS